jgi:alpha-L-rhamnosidase
MKSGRTQRAMILCLLVCFHLSFVTGKNKTDNLIITGLQCEYASNPVGIDGLPQLSWRLESAARATKQTAYRVIVATSLDRLHSNNGDVWDTEKVLSSKSTGIRYNGREPESRQRYYWKVQVWDNRRDSSWSEPAFFEMGLLNRDDWMSGWIGYVPGMPGRTLYFKGTFVPQKPILQARTYISGLGFYELYINHKKVGDHVLDPAQSAYSKRVYYVTYDVGSYLSEQANSIVAVVAPGWTGSPRLRIQIEVTYRDGSREILTSERLRSVTAGPVMYATVFDGEHYDARLDIPDIHQPGVPPGLMNKDWAWAHNTDDPAGEMEAQKIDPIKVVETITPVSVKEPVPGVYVFDAGRNLAGWASLRVQGKEGAKVTLRFAETLYENGLVNQENLRNAKVEDSYSLNGKGVETWEPAFTYHGFRYVQVEGLPRPPEAGDIQVKAVRSSVSRSGTFTCSNPLLNDIHRMVVNTEAGNLHSVPTDCPQRDERMGWLNDLTVRIEQAIYNFNMSRFYPKFMDDIQDTQDQNGTITCVAPFRFGMRPADPVSASYLILALKCYEFYGNEQMVADHFDGMKAWVDYLYSRTENGIVDYSYYGDWCPPRDFLMHPDGSGVSRDTPGKLISTGYLYYCARILSDMAKVVGRDADASRYGKLAGEIYAAFNREYWNEQTGGYGSNNQACNSFALYLGLADEKKAPRALVNLAEDVKKHDYHLTTGNLCTKYLLEVLTEQGHPEVAYRIATQTTYPGWGFMLSKGATTLWERWEYATGDAMNSHNHPMMGSVGSWFYKYILGITPDMQHPAFERFNIRPVIFNDLSFAEGELVTEKGTIKSAWKKNGKILNFDITIPANSTAIVYVPAGNIKTLTESGKSIGKVKELKFLKEEGGYVILEAGSGTYSFRSAWK